ncbi:MAG: hypothetical protein HN390_07620 [Anaerolineae bacterium]|jgi:hypothetical protein|nr:hypothetical protein [Anaerolineae bacterium]MBT7191644.1 hypothetical protein [Anaerolineae bacterium]MBT7991909.1 hypothetical protein [Anaerolineae bacterium]
MPVEKHHPFKRPIISRADIFFWAALILLNALLFLPAMLFLQPEHFFSFNLEVSFALILWAIFASRWQKNGLRWFWRVFLFLFYFAIIYKSYASILIGVYQMQPNFYNDASFIANGLPFLLSALDLPKWVYLGFVVTVLSLFVFLWHFTKALLIKRATQIGRITQMLALSLGAVLLIHSGISLGVDAEMPTGVDSLVAETKQNLSASRASYQNIDTFIAQNPYATYDYAQYNLAEKPNVYIIFFESYGSVLYKHEYFRPAFTEMATAFEARLADEGWQSVSAFSEAPTWGGGSWMSYTSALFGIRVSEQSQYKALREQYAQVPYPNMGRYFHTQGYEYLWVVPINRELPPKYQEVDYAFYGADRWITYDTLEYAGPLYGWGPSPPDQYTFGFMQDLVQEQQPTFLFFLNQDSHYPWIPLPERVDDWRTLANSDAVGGSLSSEEKSSLSQFASRENYLAATEHSFANIADFITTLNNPNAIIMLVGDHQPPTVSRKDDGFETMLHIISQDNDFLENFQNYGFEQGILLDSEEVQLKHEGFYSLFIRNFLARYGRNPENLPPYLVDGLFR